MRYWLIVTLIILSMPAFGSNWVKYEDLNRDGVKEKIVYKERLINEKYYLATMTITHKSKVVFQAKNFCTDFSAIRFDDVDKRFSGKEIIMTTQSNLVEVTDCVWDPKHWGAEFYRWNPSTGNYQLYWIVRRTNRTYSQGEFNKIIQDTKSQWPKFDKAVARAQQFIRAAGREDWRQVQTLLSKEKGSVISLQEVKTFKAYRQLPPPEKWVVQDSPHDPSWIFFVFPFKRDYGIIVTAPDGIFSFSPKNGQHWD